MTFHDNEGAPFLLLLFLPFFFCRLKKSGSIKYLPRASPEELPRILQIARWNFGMIDI